MAVAAKEMVEELTRTIEGPDHTSRRVKENPTDNAQTDNNRRCDAPDRASYVGEYDLDRRSSSPSPSKLIESKPCGMQTQHFPRNS
jgi:hypothetical protein